MRHDNCDLKKIQVDFFFQEKLFGVKNTYFVCKNNAIYHNLGIYSSIPICILFEVRQVNGLWHTNLHLENCELGMVMIG